MRHMFQRRGLGSIRCADECAAFLDGQALHLYETNGLVAPAWAHVNWIAHCEPTTIVDQVRGELGLHRPPGGWQWAISTIARELIEKAGASEVAIRILQRECLIPMELALLGGNSAGFLPNHLVTLGVPRLRAYPFAPHPDV